MQDGDYNAKIQYTTLGLDDHGFALAIGLDFGTGGHQGFGAFNPGERTQEYITDILAVAAAEHWERLQGKFLRARIEDGLIIAIGHILNDVWFEPRKLG